MKNIQLNTYLVNYLAAFQVVSSYAPLPIIAVEGRWPVVNKLPANSKFVAGLRLLN